MSRNLTVAVIQASFGANEDVNIETITDMIVESTIKGADIVVLPELFCGQYFCKTQDESFFRLARTWRNHPAVDAMQRIARDYDVVIPTSIFERDGPHTYNSVVMVDAGGEILGVYRKSHIPDGPGYQEKFYFRPGNTGFKVWDTRKGKIGVGICWDQWFPEVARSLVLNGAELLVYPTTIGSEPQDSQLDTSTRWRLVMRGQAIANVVPIAAANRVGTEGSQIFYGNSFITDPAGEIVAELNRQEIGIKTANFDLDQIQTERHSWGFFRDRRPELYRMSTEVIK